MLSDMGGSFLVLFRDELLSMRCGVASHILRLLLAVKPFGDDVGADVGSTCHGRCSAAIAFEESQNLCAFHRVMIWRRTFENVRQS